MKLTSHSAQPAPHGAAAAPVATLPARAAQRPASPDTDLARQAGTSGPWRTLAPADASERQSLAQGFAFSRALTRGRIEGLQTALRVLSQAPVEAGEAGEATASNGVQERTDLPELRRARVSLCERLQAQYALFLGDPAATPEGLPRSSRGSWRRSQLRQLLQEDLDWARSLPGDHRDLVRAIDACLAQVAAHGAV